MSDERLSDERRGKARVPIELKVGYQRVNAFLADYTSNISKGGTIIATERPLAVGTQFVFALGIPKMDEPLRLRGKVMWITSVEEASKANPAGMGIEFLYPDDSERTELEKAVRKLVENELGKVLAERILGPAH